MGNSNNKLYKNINMYEFEECGNTSTNESTNESRNESTNESKKQKCIKKKNIGEVKSNIF